MFLGWSNPWLNLPSSFWIDLNWDPRLCQLQANRKWEHGSLEEFTNPKTRWNYGNGGFEFPRNAPLREQAVDGDLLKGTWETPYFWSRMWVLFFRTDLKHLSAWEHGTLSMIDLQQTSKMTFSVGARKSRTLCNIACVITKEWTMKKYAAYSSMLVWSPSIRCATKNISSTRKCLYRQVIWEQGGTNGLFSSNKPLLAETSKKSDFSPPFAPLKLPAAKDLFHFQLREPSSLQYIGFSQ